MATRCPQCDAAVADGMRFCGECGALLTPRCPSCGAEAAPGQRFCSECGASLRPAAAARRERRLVSVLFCDLVGFTTFSESRDAEDVRDVLGGYFDAARRIAADFGGTIEKFIGDAVMILWGAPVAHEDDAERAVRAGLAIVAAVAAHAERLATPEFRVRVGVLTGEAAVEIGREGEGMVIGDAVNTASRIQSIADPGSVLVDDTTRLACQRTISFEPAGAHALKGKSAPVRVWRVLGIRDAAAGTGIIEPPLVGRDAQLDAATRRLDELLGAQAGVSVLGLVGEAGIGKSRLSRELEERSASSEQVAWHRGRSLTFGEGGGLSALAEIVRTQLGLGREDPPDVSRARVDQRLAALFAESERERIAGAVHRLLGLDGAAETGVTQGELFSAWRALLERLAADRPLVLVFEELQLADEALFDFIAHLQEWSSGAPILILALSRPDERVARVSAGGERIDLGPLSAAETDELVARTVADAPAPLLEAIRADGGGVPLYAVETLRELAERGVLAVEGSHYAFRGRLSELALPPTIRSLVSARLDRLALVERRLMAAGAVLGESFTPAGAAEVAGVEADTAEALLAGLAAKVFLAREQDPLSPRHERYSFPQGVVRRVVLAGLSRHERKRAHLAAFRHLWRLAGGDSDQAAVLAGHLLAAERAGPRDEDAAEIRTRAASLLPIAADRAAAVGTPVEALRLFDQALELTPGEAERAALLERAGIVAERSGDAHDALERFRTAQELHRRAGRDAERRRTRARELRVLAYQRDPAEHVVDARALEAEGDGLLDAATAMSANVLAFALYQAGRHEDALAAADRAALAAEACGDRGEAVQAQIARASALQELQRPEEAIALQRHAAELAERHDASRLPSLLTNMAISLGSVGRFADAARCAREAIAAAERGANRLIAGISRLVLARALCSLGAWEEAIAEIEPVKALVPPYYVGMAIAPLVAIALARGELDRAGDLVAEHDARSDGEVTSDFRILRAVALAAPGGGPGPLAELIASAQTEDFAEWTGWLPPIVDRLVAAHDQEALAVALAALERPGALRRMPPVRAQALRVAAHLAAAAGDRVLAGERLSEAERLASGCGLVHETRAIAREQRELSRAGAAGT